MNRTKIGPSGDTDNRPRIGLVTHSELPDLIEGDRLLQRALVERGFDARAVVWDDPTVDWHSFDLCVIRSTWDYHRRLDDFLAWVALASSVTALWNSLEVVRWNSRKTYLRDLAERGVPIVPTVWLERGERADLAWLMRERGWERAVVKPTVSANAYQTVLVTGDIVREGQAHLDRLLEERDVMVQPFIASVETYRERSLLFIDGELTHAVSRPPQLSSAQGTAGTEGVPTIGTSLGQAQAAAVAWPPDEYAGVTPDAGEVALATGVLRAAGRETLYARVDLVRGEAGTPLLLELELVEPSLFLSFAPAAVDKLAHAIAARVSVT